MGGLGQRTDSEAAFQEFLKRIPSATALSSQHQDDKAVGGMLGSASAASLFGSTKDDGHLFPRVESLEMLRGMADTHERDGNKLPSLDLQAQGHSASLPVGHAAHNSTDGQTGYGGSTVAGMPTGGGVTHGTTQLFRPSGVVRSSASVHMPEGAGVALSMPAPSTAGSAGLPGMAPLQGDARHPHMAMHNPSHSAQPYAGHPDLGMQPPSTSLLYQGGMHHPMNHPSGMHMPGSAGLPALQPTSVAGMHPGAGMPKAHNDAQSGGGGMGAGVEQEKLEQRRARRMLSNRESARRSRKRKQEQLQELEQQINALEKKNEGLEQQCQAAAVHVQKLMTDKQRLENENQHLMSIFHQLQKSLGKEKIRLHLPAALGGAGPVPTTPAVVAVDEAGMKDERPASEVSGEEARVKRSASAEAMPTRAAKRSAGNTAANNGPDEEHAAGNAGTSREAQAS